MGEKVLFRYALLTEKDNKIEEHYVGSNDVFNYNEFLNFLITCKKNKIDFSFGGDSDDWSALGEDDVNWPYYYINDIDVNLFSDDMPHVNVYIK